jgi:hypothetical protein
MLSACFGATFVYDSLEDSNSAGNDLSDATLLILFVWKSE